ncbi:MAG: class I SAM-dependent methyltransferase [Rhodospirillaceae bacterium]|nr:class I SAM-dependent methyltransferase [Rhodospirillaceae bacterium]
MPEAPLHPLETGDTPDLDAFFKPTHDEVARTRYVVALLNHAMMNLRYQVRDEYTAAVEPNFIKAKQRPARTAKEIFHAIKGNTFFRTYSSLRYNAQEMGPHAVQPVVERVIPQLNAAAAKVPATSRAGGTLRLNPRMAYPQYLVGMDAHLTPGGYWSEHAGEGDVSQALLFQGRRISGPPTSIHRDFGSVGTSVGTWLARKFPDFKPKRMLDLATQEGKQLYGYRDLFPGVELHGLDIAAPSLRYGHVQAAHKGVAIHFSQQNAESIDYPDGHFDLIVSSFFLHEISVPATKRVLAECYRLLSPGGIMAHMELPPSKMCDPLLDFSFNWDSRYNNEPHYAHYRAQDPTQLAVAAGFPRAGTFELEVPVPASVAPENYEKFLKGEIPSPPHGRGGWFIFGGRKAG